MFSTNLALCIFACRNFQREKHSVRYTQPHMLQTILHFLAYFSFSGKGERERKLLFLFHKYISTNTPGQPSRLVKYQALFRCFKTLKSIMVLFIVRHFCLYKWDYRTREDRAVKSNFYYNSCIPRSQKIYHDVRSHIILTKFELIAILWVIWLTKIGIC